MSPRRSPPRSRVSAAACRSRRSDGAPSNASSSTSSRPVRTAARCAKRCRCSTSTRRSIRVPKGGPRFRPAVRAARRQGAVSLSRRSEHQARDVRVGRHRHLPVRPSTATASVPLPPAPRPADRRSSMLASAWRPAGGARYVPAKPPPKPLELYSFEASPFCRIVRERLCALEIPYVLHNVAKGSPSRDAFVERSGKMMVPYLVDPNTGKEMFESADIVAYLRSDVQGEAPTSVPVRQHADVGQRAHRQRASAPRHDRSTRRAGQAVSHESHHRSRRLSELPRPRRLSDRRRARAALAAGVPQRRAAPSDAAGRRAAARRARPRRRDRPALLAPSCAPKAAARWRTRRSASTTIRSTTARRAQARRRAR